MRRAGWCLARISGRTACSRAQPDDQRGDRRRAEVDVTALVVARGDRAKLLELVDRPFDGVALLVALGVEARWPPSARSFAPAGGLGVGLLRLELRAVRSWPSVMSSESGRQRPFALRWILAVNPPRERPSPSAPAPPPPDDRTSSAGLLCPSVRCLRPFGTGAGGAIRAPAAC